MSTMLRMSRHVRAFQGARRADVTEAAKGFATMAGTFKLTFKGHSTDSLSYNAAAADIKVSLSSPATLVCRSIDLPHIRMS